MLFVQSICDMFRLKERTLEELIKISTLIDAEKSKNGALAGDADEVSVIACMVVALMTEISTSDIGNSIYAEVNRLIVEKNETHVDASSEEKILESANKRKETGVFQIIRGTKGFYFVLKSASGQMLATSELYSKSESCANGVESVKRNSTGIIEDQTISNYSRAKNPKFEVFSDKEGRYRFRLKAQNGEVIAVSGEHSQKDECISTIKAIKDIAATAYLEKG